MNSPRQPFLEFLRLVRDLCQLRRGPQDLAYSPLLLLVLVVASVLLDMALGGVLEVKGSVLPRSLLSTALILALCWTALAARGLGNRFVQAGSALVACAMAFSLLMLPIAALTGTPPATPEQLTPLQVLLAWLALAIIVWKLSVDAHILRHALDAPFALGFLLALAWALADWALGRAVFDTTG
ncbi:MAG TPA: hypothetical protein VFG55_04960 [Rhodanobacteraceae bacterium]|nr:hypothetical protein [Rhodanobacteraceae bacterium]